MVKIKITKRENEKRHYLTSRELCNILLSSVNGIAVYKGPEFIIEALNEPMLSYWGKNKIDTVIGMTCQQVPWHKSELIFMQAVWQNGLAYKNTYLSENILKNGILENEYLNSEYQLVKNEKGEPAYILHSIRDVTAEYLEMQQSKEDSRQLKLKLKAYEEELMSIGEELELAYIQVETLTAQINKKSS